MIAPIIPCGKRQFVSSAVSIFRGKASYINAIARLRYLTCSGGKHRGQDHSYMGGGAISYLISNGAELFCDVKLSS